MAFASLPVQRKTEFISLLTELGLCYAHSWRPFTSFTISHVVSCYCDSTRVSGSVVIPFANNIANFYSGCRLSTYSAIVIEAFILTY